MHARLFNWVGVVRKLYSIQFSPDGSQDRLPLVISHLLRLVPEMDSYS